MIRKEICNGVVHDVPQDLQTALKSSRTALAAWEDTTPLARNEWICWILPVKKAETRADHIRRARAELIEGKPRPCCWAGCPHR